MAKTLRLFTQITPVLLQLAVTFRTANAAAQTTASPTAPSTVDAAAAPVAPPASTPASPSSDTAATPSPGEAGIEPSADEAVPSSAPATATTPCPCPPSATDAGSKIQLSAGADPMFDQPQKVNKGPIREERPWVLSAEWGWNSLAGLGPVVTRHLDPHFSLDAGAGVSLAGTKFGARARYNFLKSDLTPFLGLGAMHALGVDTVEVREDDRNDDGEFVLGDVVAEVRVGPSTYAQAVVGLDWIDRNTGVNLMATAGYAQLLQKDNIEVVSGELEGNDRTAAEASFGSSIAFSLAMGYSF